MEARETAIGLLNLYNELRKEARADIISAVKTPDNIINHISILMKNGVSTDSNIWVVNYKINGKDFTHEIEFPIVEIGKDEKYFEKNIYVTKGVLKSISDNVYKTIINEWVGQEVL